MSTTNALSNKESAFSFRVSMGPAIAPVLTLFFSWGFLTCLNDVLIARLKLLFHLTYSRAMLVQVAFFLTCFVFAFPAGTLLQKLGYKWAMSTGLLTMSAGALWMVPAARTHWFALFLVAICIMSAGITMLQVSSGPYVSLSGPTAVAASRFSLALAFNSLGTMLAPAFGGWLILKDSPSFGSSPTMSAGSAPATASSLILPYFLIAAGLLALAVFLRSSTLPPLPIASGSSPDPAAATHRLRAQRALLFGAPVMFLYVGAEVAIGSFLILYLGRPEIGPISPRAAAFYVMFYWAGSMIGRFFGAKVLLRSDPSKVLALVASIAAVLVATSILSTGHVAMWSILAVGLCNSVMVPVIYTRSILDLGPLLPVGSSILVAVVVGGACIPFLQGMLADHFGLHHSFFLVFVCYACIACYGFAAPKNTFGPPEQFAGRPRRMEQKQLLTGKFTGFGLRDP